MNQEKKYLLVFDLDGTLLDDTKHIMPKTKAYLEELTQRGHIIALASGRPPRAILPYYNELGLNTPIISYNGACITDPKNKEIPDLKYFFPKEAIIDFVNRFQEGEIVDAFAENDDTIFLLRENEGFANMFHREGMKIVYGDFRNALNADVYAAVFQYRDSNIRDASYHVPLSDNNYFIRGWYGIDTISEFGNHRISKANGIRHIQKIYCIDNDNIIAFGDAENDVEMLTEVSHPFAMVNGNRHLIERVKATSVADNNHEGIYLTLKQLFQED